MSTVIDLEQAMKLPDGQLRDLAYNALDCTGTREVFDNIWPSLDEQQKRYYRFCLSLQNATVTMLNRGIKVNVIARKKALKQAKLDLKRKGREIDNMPLIQELWDGTQLETGVCPDNDGKRHRWPRGEPDETRKCSLCGAARMKRAPINPNSSQQVMHLLYDLLGLPEMTNKMKKVSVDEDVVRRIGKKYPKYRDLTDTILTFRDLKKQISFLNARLTYDNRYVSSPNIGGTWSGRFSSSKGPLGEGNNVQNIAERHRHIFEADPGMEICYADLKQAESNTVAHLAGDEKYIEAHASGDVHTYVTRLVWPNLPWTGDLKKDKEIAKTNPPWDQAPGHNYRFQSKRIQHGSNYGLSPYGIAMIAKIPLREAEIAQERYYDEFSGIPIWQASIRQMVQNQEPLVTPLGHKVQLLGRPWDEHTFKQGLAFIPQSTVANIINIALWHLWKRYDPELIQLLAQVHDAILLQYSKDRRSEALPIIRDNMQIPVPVGPRTMRIEVEAAVGHNWGHRSEDNPRGIVEVEL